MRALVEGRSDLLVDGLRALAVAGFYTANFAAAFHRDWLGGLPIGQLWSLAEEEQFYLLWPVALLALLRFGVHRRRIMVLLCAVIAAVVAERFTLWFSGSSDGRIYYGPDTHSDALLAGVLLALALLGPPRLRADRSLGYFSLAALAIVAYRPTLTYTGTALVVIPACVGLVATVVAQPQGLVARAAAWSPLVAIGRISYSLYLWHELMLWTFGPQLRWPAIATAFMVAAASYRYVEQPFLRRKRAAPTPAPAELGPTKIMASPLAAAGEGGT
jgi:peptidoglycan/LPS O-acetylase OafA/YrhL